MAQASQGFLKITDRNGNLVRGECIDADHLEEIDLTGWNWGVTDPAAKSKKDSAATDKSAPAKNTASRSGSSANRETGDNVEPAEFTFSKRSDRSSTRLINSMNIGEVFPSAVLVLEEEFEQSPLPFRMELVFTNMFFTGLTWNVSAAKAGAEFNEDWTFTYTKIKVRYLWRGKPPGWIEVEFDRNPEAKAGASKKEGPTKAEKQDAEQQRIDAAVKAAVEAALKKQNAGRK